MEEIQVTEIFDSMRDGVDLAQRDWCEDYLVDCKTNLAYLKGLIDKVEREILSITSRRMP